MEILGQAAGSTAPTEGPPSPKPGDGAGPSRLRDSLGAVKSRGAYKCKKCGVKHGEGKPCGSAPEGPRSASAAPVPPIQVFTPENTGRLLRVPFTISAVKTNCKIWLLTPSEEAELVATAVPCANEWIAVDPKWVALFMFSFSLAGVALSKAMDYSAWRLQMMRELGEEARKKKQAEQPAPNNAGPMPATPPPAAVSTI